MEKKLLMIEKVDFRRILSWIEKWATTQGNVCFERCYDRKLKYKNFYDVSICKHMS